MNRALQEAINRVSHYVAMRDEKPLSGLDDAIHTIHTGTEWEASLSLDDLRFICMALK